jgi:predicted deacetylase
VTRHLCIAVHDVAPATWPQCSKLLDLLDAAGQPPATLLVVPNFHRRGRVAGAATVVRGITRWIERGSEVALHGYFHVDETAPPKTVRDWLRRRVLTAGEGEFSALPRDEAARRIRRGLHELGDLFGAVRGFGAPAWLSSEGTWAALRASPLRYASTRSALVVLDGMRRVTAPAITVSARSRWRRSASKFWLRALCRITASQPVLRIALHPVDAQHADVLDDWRMALHALLDQRTAVTKSQAVGVG